MEYVDDTDHMTVPRPYHHGDLRRTLITVGLEMLEAQPFAALSLRGLALAVGVSANAVYRHFSNKDDLMAALGIVGFQMLAAAQDLEHIGSTTDKPSALRAFRAAGAAYVTFARKHPALFRLMFGRMNEGLNRRPFLTARSASIAPLLDAIDTLLGNAFSEAQRRATAIQSWALVHGLAMLILDGHVVETESALDQLLSSILDQAEPPKLSDN
jgi:AcrR family transcriptional regulator